VCHSRSSTANITEVNQTNEPADSGLSVVSICTPSRPKPLSRLHPKLQSPDGSTQSTKAGDSKLALTSFCTPSRAKSSLNARRDCVPHPHSTSLSLPHSYYVLGELFQSADTIVSWLTNRTEICTFDKLKAAVQDMTKRYKRSCIISSVICYCIKVADSVFYSLKQSLTAFTISAVTIYTL